MNNRARYDHIPYSLPSARPLQPRHATGIGEKWRGVIFPRHFRAIFGYERASSLRALGNPSVKHPRPLALKRSSHQGGLPLTATCKKNSRNNEHLSFGGCQRFQGFLHSPFFGLVKFVCFQKIMVPVWCFGRPIGSRHLAPLSLGPPLAAQLFWAASGRRRRQRHLSGATATNSRVAERSETLGSMPSCRKAWGCCLAFHFLSFSHVHVPPFSLISFHFSSPFSSFVLFIFFCVVLPLLLDRNFIRFWWHGIDPWRGGEKFIQVLAWGLLIIRSGSPCFRSTSRNVLILKSEEIDPG